jgi:DNA-binding MarR family transcriptional regulator
MARQIVAIFPWIGQLWASAVRDAGGGSTGRYKVLNILGAKGPIRAGELANLCAASPSAMSDSIESLSAEGFVRRVDDPTDRRAVVVALTEQGGAELERVRDLMTGALVKQLDGLTTDQRSRLRAAVNDLTEILIDPATKKENPIVR